MKPSLQLKLGPQLIMTPQLQQAIRLLQLSALDLRTEIQNVLETNPMLDLESGDSESDTQENAPSQEEIESEDENEILPWEKPLLGTRTSHARQDDNTQTLEKMNVKPRTLRDHLLWQMRLTTFSDQDKFIGVAIIDSINDDGFLTCPLEDILATISPAIEVDLSEVEVVLHRIQQFDPIGVGARSVSECLSVQLKNLNTPWQKKALDLVCYHLDALVKKDYATLCRRLNVQKEELAQIIHCIQSLNPRPGLKIGANTAEYIVPDVIAHKKGETWEVYLNPECTPKLAINDYYASLVRKQDPSPDNQFLKNQLQEARWFLKGLQMRHETLLKVAQSIVDEQEAFLEYGEEAMKPLTLHNIAEQLDMHESTISRITSQKYITTPRGTFELKFFFSSHIGQEDGGECSSTAIRALIKKMIHDENRGKPLSDSKLVTLLGRRGINIARRTVAKYREELSIPPSFERKQLF